MEILDYRPALLYPALGHKEEARASVQDVFWIDPKLSAQRYARGFPYKDRALAAQVLELNEAQGGFARMTHEIWVFSDCYGC
jgi:hypothetical protein